MANACGECSCCRQWKLTAHRLGQGYASRGDENNELRRQLQKVLGKEPLAAVPSLRIAEGRLKGLPFGANET